MTAFFITIIILVSPLITCGVILATAKADKLRAETANIRMLTKREERA